MNNSSHLLTWQNRVCTSFEREYSVPSIPAVSKRLLEVPTDDPYPLVVRTQLPSTCGSLGPVSLTLPPPLGGGYYFTGDNLSCSWLVIHANPFSNHFAHFLRCLCFPPSSGKGGGGGVTLILSTLIPSPWAPMFFVMFAPSPLTALQGGGRGRG